MAFISSDLSKPAAPYVHQSFPKYVTHADGRSQVVPDDAAWQALGPGWGRPDDVPAAPVERDTEPATDGTLGLKPKRKARG